MSAKTKQIVCTHFSSGKKHDYKLFKESLSGLSSHTIIFADSGYQGIEKIYPNSFLPYKSTKTRTLTEKMQQFNRQLSQSRVLVEHVIRSLKIFKIVSERYRNRRNRFNLRMNLIAALYNYEQ